MDPEAGQIDATEGEALVQAPDTLWSSPLVFGGGGVGLLVVLLVAVLGGRRLRTQRPIPELPEPETVEIEAPRTENDTTTELERPAVVEAPARVEPPARPGLAAAFKVALTRSRAALQGRFDTLFGRDSVDEELWEELEETLLTADVGVPTTQSLVGSLRDLRSSEPAELRAALRERIAELLRSVHAPLTEPPAEGPWVVLVVGVNGSGKTTTIGKLAARLTGEGRSVLLAAADTYRAAAAEQLTIWAERAGAEIVAHEEGSDPGAVAYDALQAALARGSDVVIVDTAGRLQTRKPLMQQLEKIRRVIDKVVPGAPHETLLVVDGTMGQNALSQARTFNEATPLTGVAVTKLDGTAKGGMILTIAAEMEMPVKLVGIGEGVGDLREFEVEAFVEALA